MTINSMTGFARVSGGLADGSARWLIELKTVNARALDLKMRLPAPLDHLEPLLRLRIGKALARGSCQVLIQLVQDRTESGWTLNEAVLGELYRKVNAMARTLGAEPVGLSPLLGLKGVFEADDKTEPNADTGPLDAAVLTDIDRALAALIASRADEGRALLAILDEKIDRIAGLVSLADAHPSRRPEVVRARLEEAIQRLMEGASALDPQRLHQEAVLLATKADIREELDRLGAHVEAARTLLKDGGSIGRRLDFLTQELARESNTLCAKSSDIGLTAIGLDLKTLVEQFREQIQNVE